MKKGLKKHKIQGWAGIGGDHSAVNYTALRDSLNKVGKKAKKIHSPL